MALLGFLHFHQIPAKISKFTGAERDVILGKQTNLQ